MPEPVGYLSVLLHAHLPFVRHPEYSEFLEEDWLFEAMTETYIPLLRMLNRLWDDGVDFALTMSMTPPLCEMLVDPMLAERYERHLRKLCELAEGQARDKSDTPFHDAAYMYLDGLRETLHLFTEVWDRQLIPQFRTFLERDRLEIITCGATHGFLPLMETDTARRAQIEVACRNYEKHFGRRPAGFWLPECAYTPGLELLLREAGIRFFFLETHGLALGSPSPRAGVARPVYTPSGVAAFARDPETSRQVWSADEGYPGDGAYREFYRDVGYDLPYEQARPYLHSDGIRRNIGLKFHRITGKVALDHKEPYIPELARERADEHAGNFLFNRQAQVRHLRGVLGEPPHLTATYDAELFGHWWFEGPQFLEYFFRKAACDQDELRLTTPKRYLDNHPIQQECQPALSSWGRNGYYEVWLNSGNDWIYPHLHNAEGRMIALAHNFQQPTDIERRALNQAARELLLAQSSDWAFIISMNTTVPYAQKRTKDHISRFLHIADMLDSGHIDEEMLRDYEWRDSIFQEIDYSIYRSQGASTPYSAVS